MSDAANLLQQINTHLQAGENMQAATLLEPLLAADPSNALLRGKLMTAYLRASVPAALSDAAEAERLLKRALEVDGSNDNAQKSYIKFLRSQGRHQEADERSPDRLYLFAKKAYDARDYTKSIEHFEQLLAIDPDNDLANKLLPAAYYRAGRYDHPSVERERKKQANPVRFADGLAEIAKVIGVSAPAVEGRLPDRSGWTEAQRYEWGRRVDVLIRDQILGGTTSRADVQCYTRPFKFPAALRDEKAVIFLLHVGSIHLSFGQIIQGDLPFNHVTNSLPIGVAFPGRILDVLAIPPNALLTRMALALRRGGCVTVAVDGPLGQRADGFEHLGVEYSIAAGPLILAQTMKAKTYLLVAGYEEFEMACRLVEGPAATTPLEELQAFWGNFIRSEVARQTEFGPENYIQHESSQMKALTVSPFKPK